MFETELQFFKNHQDELLRTYQGRVLVIRGESVEGDYGSPLEAYLAAKEKFEPSTFLIQPCMPGPDAYTVTISSSAAAV